ncbi:hypothetical protein LINPERHAP1_LOCUS38710 [Linum perenne]
MTHTCRHFKKIVDYDPRFKSILGRIGLYQLRDALRLTPDPELITALVKRWCLETNTFHLCHGLCSEPSKEATSDLSSGRIKITFLHNNFSYMEDAISNDDTVTIHQYCRAYILDFFGSCVFADRSGWLPWDGFEDHSPMTFIAYRVVTPLICYFSVHWHRPDRVLRQFGMDRPLPTFDMPRSEVILNLEITQWGTQQGDWVARLVLRKAMHEVAS